MVTRALSMAWVIPVDTADSVRHTSWVDLGDSTLVEELTWRFSWGLSLDSITVVSLMTWSLHLIQLDVFLRNDSVLGRSEVPHESPNHVVPLTKSFHEKTSNRIKCKLIAHCYYHTSCVWLCYTCLYIDANFSQFWFTLFFFVSECLVW